MDADKKQRERELDIRREGEKKDLEVERTIGQRPLEGLSSGGHTTWTGEQDDAAAATVHENDERVSREASERQIPAEPKKS